MKLQEVVVTDENDRGMRARVRQIDRGGRQLCRALGCINAHATVVNLIAEVMILSMEFIEGPCHLTRH